MQKRHVCFIVILTLALSVILGCYLYISPLDPKGDDNLINLDEISSSVFEDGTVVLGWDRPESVSIDDIKVVISPIISDLNYDDFYETNSDPESYGMDIRIPPEDVQTWDNLYFRIGYYDNSTGEERIWWSRIIHYPLANGITPMTGGVTLREDPTFNWNESEGAARYSFQVSKSEDTLESSSLYGWDEPVYSPGELFPLTEGDTVYWRTRVEERNDEYSVYHLWSDVYSFTYKSSLEIGDLYAGGNVFYLDGSTGMCAAPRQSALVWGIIGFDVNGDDSGNTPEYTTIGTGESNTASIVSAYADSDSSYAAKVCHDLVYNGYEDWFLPSQDEMIEMETTKADNNLGIGDDVLWTSTEIDADYAYSVVTWGADSNALKNTGHDFFPVRSFTY